MTRKVKDNKGATSVIGGSILGLILSITLAVGFIQTLGNNGLLREGMESNTRNNCGGSNVYRWYLDA